MVAKKKKNHSNVQKRFILHHHLRSKVEKGTIDLWLCANTNLLNLKSHNWRCRYPYLFQGFVLLFPLPSSHICLPLLLLFVLFDWLFTTKEVTMLVGLHSFALLSSSIPSCFFALVFHLSLIIFSNLSQQSMFCACRLHGKLLFILVDACDDMLVTFLIVVVWLQLLVKWFWAFCWSNCCL
jgi:hypothetical protein